MKKQILTGLGVLLLGTSMAVAAPQQFQQRSNLNDSPAYQVQQQRPEQRYQSRETQRPQEQQQFQRVSSRHEQQLKRRHRSKKQLRREMRRESWRR
jgi:hypothetical protein